MEIYIFFKFLPLSWVCCCHYDMARLHLGDGETIYRHGE